MRKILLLLVCLQLLNLSLFSQLKTPAPIHFRTGTFTPAPQIGEKTVAAINTAVESGPAVVVLQFAHPLSKADKQNLAASGMTVLHYLGSNAFLVKTEKPVSETGLRKAGVQSLTTLASTWKIHPSLLPEGQKALAVHVSLFSFYPLAEAIQTLEEKGFRTKRLYDRYPVIEVTVPPGKLAELAALPVVEFVDVPPPPPVDLNDRSEAGTRANLLQSPDYGLTGEGVVFQINEINGYPQAHLDFMDRSILGQSQSTGNYHSTHVTGIAAGAGLVDERYKGYAPGARFISNGASSVSENNIINYGVDLANHSYGAGRGCTNFTAVNSINSAVLDKTVLDFPHLLNVYAAGNYGGTQCFLYPVGYNTVDINSQTAKSVLTVGSTDVSGELADYSSRGPVYRGRLKPEIVAPGSMIWSTVPNNTYFTNNGTSMAAPAAMGGLGLLYQRYRQLHGGTKPDNALMKPLLCNTATDKGPLGPDYGYGFGFMNLNRALQALNAGWYFTDSVSQDQTSEKTITVPAGTHQLKLMLYWNDVPASPLTSQLLVNDVDLEVTTPQSATVLPFVLDTVPALVANPATRGADHVNNIEQVVIDTPQPGQYSIRVRGYDVQGTDLQRYYVVYDLVPDSVQLTFPSRGQSLVPGEKLRVQWDSWGASSSLFQLEFSADSGASWQAVAAAIAAGSNAYDWTVPQLTTTAALLRLTRIKDGKSTVSGEFNILGVPAIQLSPLQCPGSIDLAWTAVAGATDYEVMRYRGGEMTRETTTTATSFRFANLSEDSTYWVTIRARYKGEAGRRAVALSRKPGSGDCAGSVHDGDLKMDSLLSPLFGRRYTSSQLGAEQIRVKVKNLDDAPASHFTLRYSVNGGPWVSETFNDTLLPVSTAVYRFQTPFDFTLPGDYFITLAVQGAADRNPLNDTLRYLVRNLANTPIGLTTVVTEDMESTVPADYKASAFGLAGAERFDYSKSGSPTEWLRLGSHSRLNTTKALELTYLSTETSTPGTHALQANYNLSRFDTSLHSVGLDFRYAWQSQDDARDSLLIRGNDSAPWIYLKNSFSGLPAGGGEVKGLAIGDSLRAHGQNFSSSFQVRWTSSPTYRTLILDDIKLYNTTTDLALRLDSFAAIRCGLTAATPIRVTVQNNGRAAVRNVAVFYRVDGGAVIGETVPLVPGGAAVPYTFAKPADLSALGSHTLEVWVDHPGDSYPANNTETKVVQNLPFVQRFPFLEDFETSNGGWYAEGQNASWQWGTPSSPRINGAASGKRAWKTNLEGNYNANEQSYLYTGCFNLSGLQKPVISVSAAFNTDSSASILSRDQATLQFSTDGTTWRNLLDRSWYNWPNFLTAYWYNRWHLMSLRLPDTLKTVQFRFLFRSNGVVQYEGIGLDDFHVYDSTAMIYEGPSTAVQQTVAGGEQWTALRKDGKLVAEILPRGQDPGTVTLQTFVNGGAVRTFHGQYYLDRNFVFRTAKPLTDSVRLRLYFTDKEVDGLLLAGNCAACSKPPHAFRFGVSTYTSSETGELDSAIANNRRGEWRFLPNSAVKTVPVANGYFLELALRGPTELRLSNGGLVGQHDLPVLAENLSAQSTAGGVSLRWQTATEINLDHFDVEVAKGNEAFLQEQFETIGTVASKGRSAAEQAYAFTDNTPGKTGTWYYRVRSVDAVGNAAWSDAVPVFFTGELTWQVYPNPTRGRVTLVYQAAAGTAVQARLLTATGALVTERSLKANGFVQREELDLERSAPAKGVYFLELTEGSKVQVLRVVKL